MSAIPGADIHDSSQKSLKNDQFLHTQPIWQDTLMVQKWHPSLNALDNSKPPSNNVTWDRVWLVIVVEDSVYG